MIYRSFDPYRLELLKEFTTDDSLDVIRIDDGFSSWSGLSVQQRIFHFHRLKFLLESKLEFCAKLIVQEVGKPITEARAEIRKCCATIDHYCAIAPALLVERIISSEARYSAIKPEPFGPLLAILPWNFPFWQLFRFAVPSMMAGNTLLLKHAPNVPQCALAIANLFKDAGFPDGAFSNYFLSEKGVEQFIAHPRIAGVTFTGSDITGSIIGQLAGKYLKKSSLELGGNDPMIIFSDADLELAAAAAVQSRCINAGQACNGAKRFLVEKKIAAEFILRLTASVKELSMGDPMDENTQIGPLSRLDLVEKVQRQVNQTLEQGAKISVVAPIPEPGSWFYPPTVLTGVEPGMTAFEEEIFGPVWSVSVFDTTESAIELANRSVYGLGVSVWTKREEVIEVMTTRLQTGNVFVNDFVRSDPRFPFGGVKRSGYGKELGEAGLYEFVNWKTVYRKQ